MQEDRPSTARGPEPAPEIDVTYSLVEGEWTATGNISQDLQFIDPFGLDGVPGTEDDDTRLLSTTPARDTGNAQMLPADLADLDGDKNVTGSLSSIFADSKDALPDSTYR